MRFLLVLFLLTKFCLAADDEPQSLDRPYTPFKNLATGTKRLGDTASLYLLAGGAGATAIARPFDNSLKEQYRGGDIWQKYDGLANNILGTGVPGAVAGLGLLTYGYLGSHPREIQSGQAHLESLLATGVFSIALKFATHRERPDGSNFQSFPSAHTSTVFASATSLHVMYESLPLDIVTYGLGVYTGMSRMTASKHHLSDVVFGATLGIVCGRAYSITHREDLEKRKLTSTKFGWNIYADGADSLGAGVSYFF